MIYSELMVDRHVLLGILTPLKRIKLQFRITVDNGPNLQTDCKTFETTLP